MKDGGLVPWAITQATLFGFHAWRQNSGTVVKGRSTFRGAPAGTADVIGFTRTGRFFGIECKAEKAETHKATRMAQQEWAAGVNNTLLGYAARAETKEQVLAVLEHLRKEDSWLQLALARNEARSGSTSPSSP